MKKVDWLTQTQIKSLVDDGSMFFEIVENIDDVYINENGKKVCSFTDFTNTTYQQYVESYLKNEALNIGDEFYVQEEFYAFGYWTDSGSEYPEYPWFEFSKHSIETPDNINETKLEYISYYHWEKLDKEYMQQEESRVKGKIKKDIDFWNKAVENCFK